MRQMNAVVQSEQIFANRLISSASKRRRLRQFALVRKILEDSQETEQPKRKQCSAKVDFCGCLRLSDVLSLEKQIFVSFQQCSSYHNFGSKLNNQRHESDLLGKGLSV